MASVKNLKKDIKYLTTEIIGECYTCGYLFPEVKPENINEIINDSLLMHNNLIQKINQPEVENEPKLLRSYYKSIFKELISTSDNLLDRINKLASPK